MKAAILCLLTTIVLNLNGQHYIGLHKNALSDSLRVHEKYFRIDNSTVNKVYKYLKYVDSINEQTWLFFLNDEDVCTHHKLMSDFTNYQEVISKLNNTCKQVGEFMWEYNSGGKTIDIKLTQGEWFFTVLTREKE